MWNKLFKGKGYVDQFSYDMHGKLRPYIENKNMPLIKIFENTINFFQNFIFL